MSKILIMGKGGQLAKALHRQLGDKALVIGADDADFLDPDFIEKLTALVGATPISAVINAAAYTQVDLTETTGKQEALRINGTTVGELAAWCKSRALPMVHYSSDYVFDGSGDQPWRESDRPNPLNEYGRTKLEGERLLQAERGDFLLFRTSWLYDAWGKNFFNTIRRLIRQREEINVVSDQTGAPTYVPHLATATLKALKHAMSELTFPSGIYHLCSSGETSWYGFANEIFEHERAIGIPCRRVNPIPTSAYPLPAKRPLNSRLDCSLALEKLGVQIPDWQRGLKDCLAAAELP